ncbi:sigma 54-interacting transcriptional regulator [Brevibacterium jeotgali]|uniref:sigma 54-interacting transcriptional regulator n=1 Tax=Brevibacterium jeotgali TaxID=1262550 RepID=UPI000C781DEB|nr:sigma 54-interacting transcriptional regulator [Brevibacterium jeotgali]
MTTLGGLRAAGCGSRSLRVEIRANLLAKLADGEDPWPGLHGFGATVLPQVERALIAGHDIVLLGERGQGKSRLLRALTHLLDEWSPAIAGTDLCEDPFVPITSAARSRAAAEGDDLPIVWRHRSERFVEKLATPDTSVADVIGDVDPMKVAEGRSLGDPETIHFGLVPRAHRGIVAINELPDLAERIQVALLTVMEERDVQIRGYVLRLPLDVLVVASANPEDYTNRGRIITPLKDRFGAEIRTHYPADLAGEVAIIRQEAVLAAQVPDHLLEIIARFARGLRESPAIDQSSGVSARFAIAAAETVAAAARHRAAVRGVRGAVAEAVARPVDLGTVVDVLRGKVEFEPGEEGRERDILDYGLRIATAETARERLAGVDLRPLVAAFDGDLTLMTGERVTAEEVLDELPDLAEPQLYETIATRLDATTPGQRAAAIELALEGLYLSRKLSKETGEGQSVYG